MVRSFWIQFTNSLQLVGPKFFAGDMNVVAH
jgi:hypothetical protein